MIGFDKILGAGYRPCGSMKSQFEQIALLQWQPAGLIWQMTRQIQWCAYLLVTTGALKASSTGTSVEKPSDMPIEAATLTQG